MRNRHKNKDIQVTRDAELPDVLDILTPLELPARYVMFPDELELAVARLIQIEDKLLRRNVRVLWPLNVFRYNKMLAFEVEKI